MWRNITVAAILMLLTGVEAQHSVTLSSQSLCAVTGSTVKIPCTFTTPDHSSVTQREWYRVQSSEGEPQDLRRDPQYSGRVSVSSWRYSCELTVRNVRVSDSGVYNFRFKTQGRDWISDSSGFKLTVTDLQVKVDPNTVGQREVKVTCSATCSISTARFYWYKNGHYFAYTIDAFIVLDSTSPHDEGSYSCQVYEGENHHSPAVCVLGKECWGVTYTAENVCALKSTLIDISCSYKHPAGLTVLQSVWFIKEQADGEPVDVREDEEYQGRVQYTQSSQNNCSLRITNLTERDAQTYRLGFYTLRENYTGQLGVSLSVTDLKVIVSDWDTGNKTLMCITTCTLSNNPTYVWYKNGQRVPEQDKDDLNLYNSSGDAGSYSCAVRGHEDLRSPAVCVLEEKSCWSVTYSTQTICSLIGSSVDIHSYFTFPDRYKVTKVLWFIKQQADGESVDVREDEEYQGRVQYTQSSQNNCSLRITNLTERDAQTYRFRFYTDGGDYTSGPGVSLSVTDLKVTVSDWRDQNMTLSCITTCTLSNNPTYIWYKNGQRVSDCKSASCSVAAVSGAVSYSCAVEGHDSLLSFPVYSPKNTSAVLLSSGDTVEGDSMTLSCSSDANPPVLTYSWFKQRSAANTLLTTGQNYTISNISSQHSGLYYCTAHNQMGQHNSTPTELDVLYAPRITNVTAVPSVSGDSITLLCKSDSNPISNYTWTRRTEVGVKLTGNGNNLTLHAGAYGLYYCTATNQFGSSDSSGWEYTSDNRAVKYTAIAVTGALVLIFIVIILWMRRRASGISTRSEEHSKNDSVHVYDNISAMTSDPPQTASSENQDNIQYSTVYFSQCPTDELSLYSTVQLPKAVKQEEKVEYATVSHAKQIAIGEDEIYNNLKSNE